MTPEFTCEACRVRLPEYSNGRLTPDERATIERHLATCAACQAEARAWRIIAGVVRGAEVAPPPTVPLAASLAQVRARLASRAQVALPKGSAIMPDTITTTPPSSSRTLRRSYPIIAVALLIALISAFVYIHIRPPASEQNSSIACDATHSGAGLTKYDSITAIAMTSATTGWGVGFTFDPAHSTDPRSLIVRYKNCQWQHVGASTPDEVFVSLSMGSANDGWAVGLQKVVKPSGSNDVAAGILY
jgi:hypothetical protein